MPETLNPADRLPDCCLVSVDAGLAEHLYCSYNAGGDPAKAGLNFRGEPCPTWAELPANVRAKWDSADERAAQLGAHVDGAPITAVVTGTLEIGELRPEGWLRGIIERLEEFQAGPKACEENRYALDHARRALQALERRNARRKATGAAGTDRA